MQQKIKRVRVGGYLPILLVVLAALALRLVAAYAMRDSFFERGNRFSIINPIAQQIISGNGYALYPGGPTADNEPLYPLFVTLSYFVFGTNWLSVVLTQSLLALLQSWLIYQIAIILFDNRRIAVTAAVLVLFYPVYAIASISVADTVFFSTMLALCVWLTLQCINSGRSCIAAGFAWGLAILTRMSALALFPAVAIALFAVGGWKVATRRMGVIMVCVALTILPWMLRNEHLSGRCFITTHGGIELWFAFNDGTRATLESNRTVDSFRHGIEKELPEIGVIRARKDLRPIDRELLEAEIYKREALNWVAQNPLRVVGMMPLKLRKFWTIFYNPVAADSNLGRDSMRQVIHALSYGALLVAALLGLSFGGARPWRRHALVLGCFVFYSLMHALIYGFSRLRWPLDQFVILYAAFFLTKVLLGRVFPHSSSINNQ